MKSRKWLGAVLTVAMSASMAVAFAACHDEPEEKVEGPETGVYYFDAGMDEYTIALNNVDQFTFLVMGENKTGTYALEGETLTFDFARAEDEDIEATLSDNVITLTYNNASMRFLKKINYTVSYDAQGGGTVQPSTVVNGKTVAKPEDPERDGYTFIGWYTDTAYMTPFLFDAQPVTGNITLYAYWLETSPVNAEYTVDFDLGYDAEEAPAPVQTVEGCVITTALPVPEREGYTFVGWYVSDYDSADKLTYQYKAGMPLNADTTLFAVWQSDDEEGLAHPAVSVTETGVSWNAVEGATTYDVSILDPDGVPSNFNGLDGTVTSQTFDFSEKKAGEYSVTVTAHGAGSATATTTRYFSNHALAPVSTFRVVEPSALIFEGVPNAQRYYLTIDCGNDEHNHTNLALGSSTNYNFSNCPMQEGGIRFTVTAEADGYASSVSKTFVYNRELSMVTGLSYDAATETIRWDAVPDAMSYVVSVNGTVTDVGSVTSISVKDQAAGELSFSVYPRTTGYNSPVPSALKVTKASLGVPQNIRISGNELTWNAVSGAQSYTVRVNGTELPNVTENKVDLSAYAVSGADLAVSVRANGATSSLWSDEQPISYLAMNGGLVYTGNTLYWNPVFGATYYEIQVNDGETTRIDDISVTSAKITLTQAGNNTLRVRFGGTDYLPSDWVETTVFAYEIAFDTRGGSAVESIYAAYGDAIELPVPESAAYDFDGWYNIPGGPANNGSRYEATVFEERSDMLFYAAWSGKTFTVTYNAAYGATQDATKAVVYGEDFKLEVPANTAERDTRYAFVGWYTRENGGGTRMTDENGNGYTAWNTTENVTFYAFWAEALEFVPTIGTDGKDAYSVEAGTQIALVSTVTVPATYNGAPVTDIVTGAFRNCTALKEINIPDSIRTVGSMSLDDSAGAFAGCVNLMNVNIYEVEGTHEVYYSSVDGVLLLDSPQTNTVRIAYFPAARTGIYYIPDGVEEIPTRTFASADISTVVIPDSVLFIRSTAFFGCDNLERVIFENSEDETHSLLIESYAFQGCSALKEITLPKQLGEVEAFGDVFYECNSLANVNVASGNALYSSVDGLICDALGTTVVFCPYGKTGTYTIPDTILSIGDNAFESRNQLTHVVIGAFVNSIGAHAFEDCANLQKVTFTGSVASNGTTIGNYAFYNCTALSTIVFEDDCDVVSIGQYAFAFCDHLEQIDIPMTLTAISSYAFSSCSALSSITIAGGEEELQIQDYAFNECENLATVTLEASVGDFNFLRAFDGCTGIENVFVSDANIYFADDDGVLYNKDFTEIVYYPRNRSGAAEILDSVKVIGEGTFANNSILTSVQISANVVEIGANAFNGCQSLSTVTIAEGNNALTLGNYAFSGCTSLTSIVLPDRLSNVSDHAFYLCSNLKTVAMGSNVKSISSYAFAGTALETMDIPDSVTEIGANAFDGCYDLVSVSMPASMKVIGSSIFSNCPVLSEVTIPDGVTEIGASAFEGCVSLSEIELPSTLKTIGESAFARTGLVDLYIPKSVTLISKAAFVECFALSTVVFEEGGTAGEGLVIESGDSSTGAFLRCSAMTSVSFPSQLKQIGDYAFYWCTLLTDVTFGTDANGKSLLESIGYLTFCDAPITGDLVLPEGLKTTSFRSFYTMDEAQARITSVVIPSTMTFLAEDTFYGQINLKSVTFTPLPEGVEGGLEIGETVFSRNYSLTSVEFPAHLTKLDSSAFEDCTSLESVTIAEGTTGNFSSEDGVLYYTQPATDSTPAVTSVAIFPVAKTGSLTIEEGVTVIDSYTFENSALTQINLPSSLTTINTYAFAGSKITSIEIPANVTYIGTYAFSGCADLTTVTFAEGSKLESFATTTKTSDISRAFQNTGIVSITLPASLEKVTGNLFYGCESLTTVSFEENSAVTEIGKNAFYKCPSLQNVDLTNVAGLKSIGANAFEGSGLQAIEIPNTVTSIGTRAFYGCEGLSELSFEGGGEEALVIADGTYSSSTYYGVFANCVALESVTLPARMTDVPKFIFSGCTNLSSIEFATDAEGVSNIKSVDWGAFRLTAIQSLVFPDSVTTLEGHNTVMHNIVAGTALTSITLPASLEEFDYRVLLNCTGLKEVKVSNKSTKFVSVDGVLYSKDLKTLYYYPDARTDANGTVITSYDIPYGTEIVSSFAFYHNYNAASEIFDYAPITNVTIPASVSEIGESAFQLPYLETVTFTAATAEKPAATSLTLGVEAFANMSLPAQSLRSISLPERLISLGNNAFRDCSALSSVTFEEGCELSSLGTYVFYGCEKLSAIDLPDTVNTIGQNSFYGTGLTSFVMPSKMTALPNYMFSDCEQFKEITWAPGITTIGNYAFRNCTSLTQIDIPETVTSIGQYAFAGTALTDIAIPDSVVTLGTYAFNGCSELSSVKLSVNIETIGNYTFRNCVALEEVDFGSNSRVESLGQYAFNGCTALVSISLPANLKTIGNYVFGGCTALTEVELLPSVVSIGNYAFNGCSSLELFNIYGALTSIGTGAFNGCSKLEFAIDETNTSFAQDAEQGLLYNSTMTAVIGSFGTLSGEIVIDDRVTTLPASLFAGSAVTKVTLPERLTAIPNNLFQNCESLTEVVIPSGVTIIGSYAFQNTALTSVTIGRNVTQVGSYAFQGCEDLATLTFEENGTNALRLDSNAFQGCVLLERVDLPVRVRNISTSYNGIGNYAFEGCINLKEVTFNVRGGEALTSFLSLGSYAFSGTAITTFTMPDYAENRTTSAQAVGAHCFENCVNLTTFTFNYSRQSSYYVGDYAFSNCTSLKNLNNIPTNFGFGNSNCGTRAFQNCISLTEITLPGGGWYATEMFYGCTGLEKVEIFAKHYGPNISDGVFEGCTSLKTVILPDNMEKIESRAFANCTSLETFRLPIALRANDGSLKGIEKDVFAGCTSLKEFIVPEQNCNFVAIGGNLYSKDGTILVRYAPGKTDMQFTLPASVTTIEDGALDNCSALTAFAVEEENEAYSVINGTIYSKDGAELVRYAPANSAETFTVLPNVTTLAAGAFEGCANLKEVVLSEGIVTVPEDAFKGCVNLTKVTIPDTVTSIEGSAFENCTSLASITLSAALTSIGDSAFKGSGLVNVTLSASVVSIGSYAFKDCTSLSSFTFSVGVIELLAGTFEGCTALASISLPVEIEKVAAGTFDGWTEDQMIHIAYTEDDLPTYYRDGWNGGATVVYAQPEADI